MRLGPAARVAATATGIIAVVYVLGVIVLNLVVSARLAQQNDNRIADRLAAAGRDPDVFSQRAPRTFRGAGDSDADSAPVFFWLLDARQAVTAQSPGAPALPTRPLGGQQPRDGLAVTVNAGRAGPFRLKMTRDGTSWLVAGQSLAGIAHTKRLLLYAEVLAGPFVLLAMFFGCLAVGQRALAPVEQSRRRQLEFTADASHELRTPLSVIRAETDVALSTPRDAVRGIGMLALNGPDALRVFDTNAVGIIRVTEAALPLLKKSENPVVVNISSALGSFWANHEPSRPASQVSAIVYGASKAAVSMLTVQYARAVPEVKFNAVEPGYTATELGGVKNERGRPVEISARNIVRMATIGKDGPTGTFAEDDGELGW